jgi:hypothetical protein
MDVVVSRGAEHYYGIEIRRDDGVCFDVGPIRVKGSLPHDLAHLAIETALALDRGFWGSVAEGAVFGSMNHSAGRRKPHATPHSEQVLKANHFHVSEAERLVSIFNDAGERELGPRSAELRTRLKSVESALRRERPRHLTDTQIEAALTAWKDIRARWNSVAVGDKLEFRWPVKRRKR